jgi:ribosomal protein S18 acetylase RimI-like enzyme
MQAKERRVRPAMHPLDNPIWQALTTSQAHFAETHNMARRFPPEVTSLAGVMEPTPEGYDSLARLLVAGEAPALVLSAPPEPPAGWTIIDVVPLLQMIHESCEMSSSASGLIELTEADAPAMLALAELTKPGPFGRRTHELGAYIGVRRAGSLVAMAGERLRIPGWTEISAVCTHPDYSGQGYARALVARLIEQIRQRGEQPFLHVRPENERAIALYQRLGFRDRQRFHLALIRKDL